MRIVKLFPPNYRELQKVFGVRSWPGTIFAFGDRIYNPHGAPIPPELIEHERVHCRRQGSDPAVWWRKYIDSIDFRLEEEIPAHVVEFRYLYEAGRPYAHVARRLASKLYGNMVTLDEAIRLVEVPLDRSISTAPTSQWDGCIDVQLSPGTIPTESTNR